jgi:hypothetical protein
MARGVAVIPVIIIEAIGPEPPLGARCSTYTGYAAWCTSLSRFSTPHEELGVVRCDAGQHAPHQARSMTGQQ